MGNFLLCSIKRAKNPYPVPALGIGLYSAEELCYYMNHYLYLLDEDFICDRLLEFLKDELGLPTLTAKIRRWAEGRSDMFQIILMIEQDIHYYNDGELSELKQRVDLLRQASASVRAKLRADFYLDEGYPVTARRIYEKILQDEPADESDPVFRSHILHNEGVSYARMFEWNKAMNCLTEAFRLLPEENMLKEMYQLTLLDPLTEMMPELLDTIPAGQQYKWKEEFETLYRKAERSGKSLEAQAVLEKDSLRRTEGLEKLLNSWKQEYRAMVRE